MGSVGIIPNSPHLNPELFGHLKYFIVFKCPNSNTYDLIQKIQKVLGKSAPFLLGVLAQTRNDEHFVKGILGSLKPIFVNPGWFKGVLGVLSSPFHLSGKFKHDASTLMHELARV